MDALPEVGWTMTAPITSTTAGLAARQPSTIPGLVAAALGNQRAVRFDHRNTTRDPT